MFKQHGKQQECCAVEYSERVARKPLLKGVVIWSVGTGELRTKEPFKRGERSGTDAPLALTESLPTKHVYAETGIGKDKCQQRW